jgi:hypothetical protein
MFEVTCLILIATHQSPYCFGTRECIDITCWVWTRWCQSTWCPDAEFHLHPRLDPVIICSSVYRKGLSDLLLFFLVLFSLTHFHSCRGYSYCYPFLCCYSVTHFLYYRCCISCYSALLLYPVTYFHSCHCYAHRYPVLLLLYTVTLVFAVCIATQFYFCCSYVNPFFSSVCAVLSLKMSDITFCCPILSSALLGIFHVRIHILSGNICEG